MVEIPQSEYEIRKNKVHELRKLEIEPYPYKFDVTHKSEEIKENFELLEGKNVKIAGRLMTKRDFGNLIFAHIMDEKGSIQISFEKNFTNSPVKDLSATKFVKKFIDPGDILGVEGKVYKTKTGEITIKVEKFQILSKGLRPMPEKWHGLQNPEIRFRQRYLDLIANEDTRKTLISASKIVQSIRKFLLDHNFHEIDTPVLQTIYGGAFARPFETYSQALGMKLYLRISNELYMKRLLVGGLERVFEFSKDFRNEGVDRLHYPEFTLLEFYAAYWDYIDAMNFTEDLITHVLKENFGTNKLTYQGNEINFTKPFKRVDFLEALINSLGGINPLETDEENLRRIAQENEVNPNLPRHKIIEKIFDKLVVPNLINPTFVIDHPIILSPLAKKHRTKPLRAERFELYICGIEVANAFSELNDPMEQLRRFEEILKLREEGDLEIPNEIDMDFINALEQGMPPAGGVGIGIDRLIMILLNKKSVREVIPFPHLKSREHE